MDSANQTPPYQESINKQPPQAHSLVETPQIIVAPQAPIPSKPKSRQNAVVLFVISIVLAIIATVVGVTFYSNDEGGPAWKIGLGAFAFFILSIISLQRAKQSQQHKSVTAVRTYTRNIIIVLVLLPLFVLGSSYYGLLGFATSPILSLFLILGGCVGLLALIFSRFKLALICLSIFMLPFLAHMAFGAVISRQYKNEENAKLANLDFSLYAPKKPVGKFVYEKYEIYRNSAPAYVTLHFTNGTDLVVFKKPLYFNPPTDCGGSNIPDTEDAASKYKYKCDVVGSSQKGYKVYFSPDTYYVDINSTVITIVRFPYETHISEILQLVDSLESVSAEQLKNLSAK